MNETQQPQTTPVPPADVAPTANTQKWRGLTVRQWVLTLLGVLVVWFIYYILADHYTPYTSDAYVQTYVISVAPQVQGQVVKVHVTPDQRVKKGDVLFELDARPFEYEVARSQAALESARQNIKSLQSRERASKEAVAAAKSQLDYTQTVFKEKQELLKQAAATQQEFDLAQDQYDTAQANLKQADAELDEVQQKLAAKVHGEYASIVEAQAALDHAQWALEQTAVAATVDGYVSNLQLRQGDYIDAGDAAMTLVDSGSLWIVANFRENSLARLKQGQQAQLSVVMVPGTVWDGNVQTIDWGVLRGQSRPSGLLPDVQAPDRWIVPAQRFPVRLQITGGLPDDVKLRVGATVAVTVYTSEWNPMNPLAALWQRAMAWMSYVY